MLITSFYHYGSDFEYRLHGSGGNLWCRVDGEYVTLTGQTILSDGNIYYYYIDFGSVALRKIEVFSTTPSYNGIYTKQTDSIYPAELNGPRCIVLGDSFAEGTGGNGINCYIQQFADALGWNDVWQSGSGATGFLANNADTYNTYRQRLVLDVIAYNPEIVILQGSINDGLFSASAVGAEVAITLAQLKSALPDCIILVTSSLQNWGAGKIPVVAWDIKDATKAATLAIGGYFLDVLEMPLPHQFVPNTFALSASASISSTTLTVAAGLPIPVAGGTYKFTNNCHCRIKSFAGTGPYTVTLDSSLQSAQASGAIATQVGNCLWTGTGNSGAPTGFGNSDIYVAADTTHPTAAGHQAIGIALASALINTFKNL
jgi:lysophospholipase L1-like esterase